MKNRSSLVKLVNLYLLVGLILVGLTTPSPILAQGVTIPSAFPGTKFPDIGHLVSALVSNAYVAAGIVFLFMLMIAGLAYIIGAGNENVQKLQQAHQILLWTFVGFLVILASYWIIQIIETVTGFKILTGDLFVGGGPGR